jgi:uncharacterized coiled-coil DUF342 family protein
MTVNIDKGKCVEIHRLESINEKHDELREDIKEIRAGFCSLTSEIHKIGIDLRGFSELAQGMLTRFEDRDKQIYEASLTVKETFNRFGVKIETIEERLRVAESHYHKIHVIEKTLWGIVAGIGALVVYYIQQRMA